MARQVLKVSKALDRLGYKLVVDLYTGSYSSDEVSEEHPGLRYATEVVRTIGPQYSYAYIGVPVNTFGYEWAPAVALQKDGPAGKVKLRSRAKVKMVDYDGNVIPLLVGYLVQYAHSIDEDSVVGMVMDDRWLLSKVTCFGSAVYDPVSDTEYFDAGRPLIFNYQGYPDCVDHGGKVRFAPGRLYGYKAQEAIEDSNEPNPGSAKTRARSWRCQDIAAYLRDMYYSNRRPHHPQKYGTQQLSQYIDWPSSFGNQYGFVRIPRHFELENLDVGEALGRLARKAGPYELNMVPNGWRGQMQLVQVNSRMGGTYLVGPRYGSEVDGGDITACLEDSTRVSGGTVTESIVGYFDDVCIAGDPPAVEHQFSTSDNADPYIELEFAWSAEEETNFKNIIKNNGMDEASFQMACQSEPRVYCTYRVKSNYQAYKSTAWPSWAPPYNPRILPQLLSGYAQGNNNPRDWNPREIVIEYLDESVDPPEWKPCTRFDGLELVDNGMAFRVEALRNASTAAVDRVTFRGTFSDAESVDAMAPNHIRLTCAVEREFRITGTNTTDPNSTYARINQVDKFTFLAVGAAGDYSHWERYRSFPNGNAAEDLNLVFPDKCQGSGGDKWLFSDLKQGGSDARINRHAKHRIEDVKRIDYHGLLNMHTWNPGLQPGMQVMVDIGKKSIIPKAVIKCVKFNSMTQSQEVELMAGDNSVIYDMPLPVQTRTDGGSPKPSSSTTPKTNPSTGADDYPKEVKQQTAKSEVTTSANDSSYDQSSGTSRATSGGDSRSSSGRDSSSNTSSSNMELLNMISSNNEAMESNKRSREKGSIRTGDQMSTVDESKYSPEAADRRRSEAAKSAADEREANLLKKALRKSTTQYRDDEEE